MNRTLNFKNLPHNRYWWFRTVGKDYVPPVLQSLTDDEWQIMQDWYDDSEKHFSNPGELGVPGISILTGLIGGNGLSRIVQCGHYVGYSTLLLGFLLRRIGRKRSLFSVDIDARVTEYTQAWIDRADLSDYVKLHVSDSAGSDVPHLAKEWCQGDPQLVFIDSSHQYKHTISELDLWFDAITPGGLLCMHDTSVYAQEFDSTKQGGVLSAVNEWIADRKLQHIVLNNFVDGNQQVSDLTYTDGCGFGLIQKPIL